MHDVNEKGGQKEISGKRRWGLMPWSALEQVVFVLEYGARKYSADNWKKVDPAEYKEALLRHVLKWADGETVDPESGLHHLAHACTDGLFLLWFWLNETEKMK